eukprot:CAMPEP_0176149200 /NCGR_PEP_ID=MMETSP0120_2-20121206/76118_1 /TAXON_ID=160619 /ORGANISM="Kryptoperidinium foliaceum, Strain CCMP 1326" /LENGTH=45 /DNA_ID= /DNA_START= /DNA_END= /DNA_ORIENTATION=
MDRASSRKPLAPATSSKSKAEAASSAFALAALRAEAGVHPATGAR